MTSEQWIGVHTGGAHYLDHLGILCEGLEIPLIVTDQVAYQTAQDFYPHLQVEYRDISELTLDFLAGCADVIFESGHHFALELIPLWELIDGKKMRVVYCPHGNSDKRQQTRKDISLVYGDHMHDLLETTGEISRLEQTVVIGNYRADYYRAHQQWYDNRLEALLQDKIQKDRKTVLYAPTWTDGESRSSWLLQGMRVMEEVGAVFNLLLRWHPFLDDLYPAESEKMKYLCQQMPGVADLSAFPSIYPILQRADFYLGDFSSIGYDFLSLNKPLFFLDRHVGEIYECGETLTHHCHWGEAIQRFQDHASLEKRRKLLAKRVFGKERGFKVIKEDLKKALSTDRASWIESC